MWTFEFRLALYATMSMRIHTKDKILPPASLNEMPVVIFTIRRGRTLLGKIHRGIKFATNGTERMEGSAGDGFGDEKKKKDTIAEFICMTLKIDNKLTVRIFFFCTKMRKKKLNKMQILDRIRVISIHKIYKATKAKVPAII